MTLSQVGFNVDLLEAEAEKQKELRELYAEIRQDENISGKEELVKSLVELGLDVDDQPMDIDHPFQS